MTTTVGMLIDQSADGSNTPKSGIYVVAYTRSLRDNTWWIQAPHLTQIRFGKTQPRYSRVETWMKQTDGA